VKKFSLFFVLFVSISLMFAFAGDEFVKNVRAPQYRQVPMERSPGSFDADQYNNAMAAVVNWLRSEATAPGAVIKVNVSEEDLVEMESFECENCARSQKLRVGLVKTVGEKISFPSLDSLTRTADGGFVWTGMVESPGATALRLHFTNFNLPDNAFVYVYGVNGDNFGPYGGKGYTQSGDFWSHTITGPVTYVQVRHFGPVSEAELKSISFNIEGAGYLSEKFLIPFLTKKVDAIENVSAAAAHCPENEDCIEDATCYNVSAVADAKDAVAYMEWVSGPWIYMCTGGLIADSDPGTQIPYFMTANHCISKDDAAENLECYFFYATSNCGGNCPDPGTFPRTVGASIVDTSTNGDHSLLQLAQNPPSGTVFLGWNNTPIANNNGFKLYRISHPSGMPQAYSQHDVDDTFGYCSGLPIGEFIYSQDITGATEGGSSGSPVVNGNGEFVGQLYGGCGYTLEVCDAEENRTVDGAFAYYFSEVEPYLTGGGSGGTDMHVHSIVMSLKSAGPNNTCKALVTIVDDTSNPVDGATVSGTFSGDASGTDSGTTDGNGEVLLSVLVVGKGAVSTFTFCVDSVTHSSYTYVPGDNVETCDTY